MMTGPVSVADNSEFHGMVSGDVRVLRGGNLELHGTVTGNLTVEVGGAAEIHGTVGGTVFNHGGSVEVFGTIGSLSSTQGASTFVDTDAVVKRPGAVGAVEKPTGRDG